MKIISVVGARPNFMKIAPFIRALETRNNELMAKGEEGISHCLVHTGQHYDEKMSQAFFDTLNIPKPDIDLGIGSGTHAEQVGKTMIEFEKVVVDWKPDWIIVVGDVNATCACSIVAKKMHVKLAHIESGLRSFDLEMPEEINRMVTDRLSDLLFTTSEFANENLRSEGVPEDKIKFVGNIMIDTLEANRAKAEEIDLGEILTTDKSFNYEIHETRENAETHDDESSSGFCNVGHKRDELQKEDTLAPLSSASSASLRETPFAVLTLHRPSNVDRKDVLEPLVRFFVDEVAQEMPLVWTLHPRTRSRLEEFGLLDEVEACDRIMLLEPIGYLEMLKLNMEAGIMLTDSGGLQEECCILGTPCVTLRENTERPVTLIENGGLSVLAGNDVERIRKVFSELKEMPKQEHRPHFWDGKTAERIVDELLGKAES